MSSGALLRQARERASLSQKELASRAGVTQSVVSDYERGRREPALSTLDRLVSATGLALDVQLSSEGRPGGALAQRLRDHRREVVDLAGARGATNIRVFGSVARGDDGPESDIDLLVDLAPGTGLLALIGLARELAEVLGAPVDVVPADSLKPDRAPSVLADAVPL